MKHKITSKSLLDLKIPGAPSVSPDGRHVVFSLRESNYEESRNVSRLWLADVEEGKCRQLTFSYEGEHAPQWSPDGKWIGFVSSRPNFLVLPDHDDDDEETDKDQVWVMPVGMGEAVRLTNANQGVREFRWTPDSKSIIYLVDEARPSSLEFANREDRHKKIDPVVEHFDKRRKQFWEISVEEKKPELIYTGDYGIEELEISPDGKHIVFTSNGTGEPNDYHLYELYVMELEGESDPNKLVDAPGGKSMPRWSPDGTKIAYVAGLDPKLSYSQECVFLVGASGGVPTNLSEGIDWDVELIHWDPGSQELLALAAEKTFAPLFAYRENKWVKLDGPVIGAVCLDFDSGRDGTIAAVAENRMTVPELFVKAKDADWKQVSNFGEAFLKNHELPEIEVINWTSDIGEIEGVVVSPSGKADAQLPLVIQVHGGPKGNSLASLRSYCHHAVFAAEGYRVLMPNYRGSAGYGNTFAVANRRDLGGGDFRDIMAGIDHLEARGLATPGKIGIMGGSYGGYMTNWAIGQTNRFTAAISMFGIFNLVTDFSNSDLWRWDPDYMGAYPWDDLDVYEKCSPSTFVKKIKTPVLITHGESDNNTFISNSKEMYQALRARGANVQFVHYPREGHGNREPNHRLDEMRRCLEWMDSYLKSGPAATKSRRLGDRITKSGYELRVIRAADSEIAHLPEEHPRLLEVVFTLASDGPVEESWTFTPGQIKLEGEAGKCPFRGIPVDIGGEKRLLEGIGLRTEIHPDTDSGRLSLTAALVYEIPTEGGILELKIPRFPTVQLLVGPKESPDEKAEG